MKRWPLGLIFVAGLYACSSDGKDGSEGSSSLVELSDEAPGNNCNNGGVRIDSGIDLNSDGILDTEEILSTRFICNSSDGQEGTDGTSALVELTTEDPGTNCSGGGVRVASGIDDNEDGILDPAEVDVVEYVCNGSDGNTYDALVTVTAEPLCPVSGAERIDIGFDENSNGTLDPGEITGTSYTSCPDGPAEMLAQWGTSSSDTGYSVAVDGSGNIYVTGETSGGLDGNSNAGNSDIFLTKYAADGTKQWTQQWGTSSSDTGYSVAVDGSNNIYVTGVTSGGLDSNNSAGNYDIFLSKFNPDGTKQWTQQWGTTDSDVGYSVAVDGSGNIYVTGQTRSDLDSNTAAGLMDIFLTKYAADGTKQWTKQWGTPDYDLGYSVAVDGSGDIYVTGLTSSGLDSNTNAGGPDIFLSKFAPDGTKQWTQQWGTSSPDAGYSVAVDGSGNIYVTGQTWSDLDSNTTAGFTDIFLSKFAPDGTKQWTQQWGTANYEDGHGVAVDSSGSIFVTGRTSGALYGNTNAGQWDIFLTKYSPDGTKQWTRQWGTSVDDTMGLGDNLAISSDDILYLTGYTSGAFIGQSTTGSDDIFLIGYSAQ